MGGGSPEECGALARRLGPIELGGNASAEKRSKATALRRSQTDHRLVDEDLD